MYQKAVPQVQLHTAGWNRKKGPKKPVDFYGVLGHTQEGNSIRMMIPNDF